MQLFFTDQITGSDVKKSPTKGYSKLAKWAIEEGGRNQTMKKLMGTVNIILSVTLLSSVISPVKRVFVNLEKKHP